MRPSVSIAVGLVVLFVVSAPAEARQTIPANYRPAAAAPAPAEAHATAGAPKSDAAPAPQPPREWFGHGIAWHDWTRMTGDWGSARTSLEDRGVTFSASYTGDVSAPGSGGTSARPVGRALADASVEFDFERLWGRKGGKAFLQYERKSGGTGSDCLGEGQGFSNIDADNFSVLYEAWIEQQFGSRLRVKAGLIDANTEFAFVENGAEFINSSMGFTPTISLLPTYPDPHAGLVVQAQPSEHLYLGGGIFNAGPSLGVGNFDARFSISEAGVRWTGRGGGRLGVGYWHAGGRAAADDGTETRLSTAGGYVVVDQSIWSREQRSVGMFVQLGMSDGRVSRISRHVSLGLTAAGIVPSRPQDVVGIAVTGVQFGQSAVCDETGLGRLPEVNVGAFYKVALSPWFALKPDLQVVAHPLGSSARPALVGTLRIEVGF